MDYKYRHRYIDGPYKALNRKSRRVFLKAMLILLICAIILVLCIQSVIPADDPDVYVVREGDTLWDICKCIYGEMHDTREMVWKMRKLNGIEDPGELRPGMKLVLPIIVD